MKLQFGHGGEAVETPYSPSPLPLPPTLQFGHGGEAVETTINQPSSGASELLQFGHGGEAVETLRPASWQRQPVHTSIRPRR